MAEETGLKLVLTENLKTSFLATWPTLFVHAQLPSGPIGLGLYLLPDYVCQ